MSLFLLPNELSTGGFSGIATIVYYFFKSSNGSDGTCIKYTIINNSVFQDREAIICKVNIWNNSIFADDRFNR